MTIKKFIKEIYKLIPKTSELVSEGYTKSEIEEILKEFEFKKKKDIYVESRLDDFIFNYLEENTRVLNLYFNPKIIKEIIQNHSIFGYIEGGYISYENLTGKFYTSYVDDIEGTMELLCNNENEFFEILLIIAEYSSNSYTGKLNPDQELAIDEYIDKCNLVCSQGDFYRLFV